MQSKPRLRVRTFIVLLGLVANLIAAGAPLLHTFLHDLHEAGHHGEHTVELAVHESDSDADHPGSDVHPQSLHEDSRLVKRDAWVFTFPGVAFEVIAAAASLTPVTIMPGSLRYLLQSLLAATR